MNIPDSELKIALPQSDIITRYGICMERISKSNAALIAAINPRMEEATKSYAALIKAITPGIERYNQVMRELYTPLSNVSDQYNQMLASISNSLKLVSSTVNKIFSTEEFKILHSSLAVFQNNFSDMLIRHQSTWDDLNKVFSNIDWDRINKVICDTYTISEQEQLSEIADNTVTVQDMKNIFTEVLEENGLMSGQRELQNSINSLAAQAEKSTDIKRKIAFEVLKYILTFLFTLAIIHQPNNIWDTLNSKEKQVIKILQNKAKDILLKLQ